jgi:peptide deformylase
LAVLTIRTFPDPVLREPAREVERITKIHRRLVSDMIETMREAPGVGLAATQVGVMERIFVWEVGEDVGAVVNPRIATASQEKLDDEEGCLSLPGIAYEVSRAARVRVVGLDLQGDELSLEGEGLLARVCQHEIDHLDGVLFIDRLAPELKREALGSLRQQALALPPLPGGSRTRVVPPEETL